MNKGQTFPYESDSGALQPSPLGWGRDSQQRGVLVARLEPPEARPDS